MGSLVDKSYQLDCSYNYSNLEGIDGIGDGQQHWTPGSRGPSGTRGSPCAPKSAGQPRERTGMMVHLDMMVSLEHY